MAALYHGPKSVVHLAYLAYRMYGRCTGASVWLANYFLKIKILTAITLTCTAEPRPALPHAALHKLVGTHFTMQVSGHTLHVALHNARCLAGRTGRQAWAGEPDRPDRPDRPGIKKDAFCEVSTNFSISVFFGTWHVGLACRAGWIADRPHVHY